ncbi:RagB/SusD family nutrient uptake outer membrane protein [Phocaeicola coprocola]|jgi:hypothetical protein|uniref:RagB/SusD family nutrient uptake outer membrane protein n=1 Tax=Phocaeicola coprocola TaxID=310298 RepID=UPI0026DB4CD2|nr:RagB/SusD family nutrient uptake outer membrane protein [Phocaeicola coprocola]
MKTKYLYTASLCLMMMFGSCSDFLDQEPDTILTQDQTYGDEALMKSVLANFYGRVMFGQKIEDSDAWRLLDEVITYDRSQEGAWGRNNWRDGYDYVLFHDLNVFMNGVQSSPVLSEDAKKAYIAEARFIRAWTYFCIGRSIGGVPIIGDQVFSYTPGMDISSLQIPRSTESDLYDYIISECEEAAKGLSKETNKNNARANYWVAKMLQARAALYAASLATYNNVEEHPGLRTKGGEVGIPAEKAKGYYQIALTAAKEVINDGPYKLMFSNDQSHQALADNFYKAVCQKDGNSEVIWTFDFVSPGKTHQFTKNNLPKSIEQDTGSDRLSVILELVEAFEPIDADASQLGTSVQFDASKWNEGNTELNNLVFYDSPTELFEQRDPRLMGTILVPGSTFAGQNIEIQAGQLIKKDGKWVELTGARNSYDDEHRLITANNGPLGGDDREINRTGFYIRKYLDETPAAGTIGRGSAMWNVHFRIAEAYLIAAEAQWMISGDEGDSEALSYINEVRKRAGVNPLTSIDKNKLIHEYRVEFAFEGHRWWTLKRFMEAHKLWNGDPNSRTAQRHGLWPYKVVAPGDPNDGKWVFIEKDMAKLGLWTNPYKCTEADYYGEIDNGWLNNNPKLVKNPYQ